MENISVDSLIHDNRLLEIRDRFSFLISVGFGNVDENKSSLFIFRETILFQLDLLDNPELLAMHHLHQVDNRCEFLFKYLEVRFQYCL